MGRLADIAPRPDRRAQHRCCRRSPPIGTGLHTDQPAAAILAPAAGDDRLSGMATILRAIPVISPVAGTLPLGELPGLGTTANVSFGTRDKRSGPRA